MTQAAAVKVETDPKAHRVQRHAREDDTGISPEDALKLANETIAKQQQTIQDTTKAAHVASQKAATATVGRLQDRETTIANSLAAATMALDNATTAYRNARTAEDVDAESEALKAMGKATLDVNTWEQEKRSFEAKKPQLLKEAEEIAKGPQVDTAAYNENAAKWRRDHPKFDSDAVYREDALDAHSAALARAMPAGSPAYIDYINSKLTKIYGQEHGKMGDATTDGGGRREAAVDRGTSSGAPPSRASDASYSSNGMTLIRNPDGTKSVRGTMPKDWEDGAKWTGMSNAEYAISMLELEEEARAGQSSVVQMGDGRIYR